MSFQLVYGDHEYSLKLVFDPHIEDRLVVLMGKADLDDGDEGETLAMKISDSISALIEFNTIPPSEKQIRYAVAVARTLNLQLAPDVLQDRDSMAQFLTANADNYRRRKSFLAPAKK